MNKLPSVWVERAKTALIVLLLLSALFLLGHTLPEGSASLADGGLLGGAFSLLTGDERRGEEAAAPAASSAAGLTPTGLLVSGPGGRRAIQHDSVALSAAFEGGLGGLLGDALGSADTPVPISESTWRLRLAGATYAVCYDFGCDVPLSALALWLGAEAPVPHSARRLWLEQDGTALRLLFCNEAGTEFYAATADSGLLGRLTAGVGGFAPNHGQFAFQAEAGYDALAPYVLLSDTHPDPTVFSAVPWPAALASQREALLRDLSFQPRNTTSYHAADGLVVLEGGDVLILSDAGTVTFHAGGDQPPRYPVASAGATPTPGELAAATRTIAYAALSPRWEAGGLVFLGMQEEEKGWTVYYDYTLDGCPIAGGAPCAAQFTVEVDAVTSFTLSLRTFRRTEARTPVLPALQAAAALSALGADTPLELALCYRERDGLLTAEWGGRP